MKKISLLLLTALALGVMLAPDAEAIPAFARKYSMSCTTCHQPYPRLKAYGEEFAGDGFTLKEQDAPRYYVQTGDDNLALIRDLPLAVRLEGWVRHETASGNEVDLSTPYNLKLLSGGAIAKNLAYYFYFYISERGEVAGVEDAFIMFNDLFGKDLDLYLGQFQVSDPLFKRELRLTYEDYEVYGAAPGESDINLKYDRGLMLTYSAPTGTDLVAEVVNGNGLVTAEGSTRVYDDDKYKNFLGRISQGINDYLRIGAFGYYGKEADEADIRNEVWMAGADASVEYGTLALNLQYVERRDDNPDFLITLPQNEIETRGGMAEATYWPNGDQSKWYGVALFNYVESDALPTYTTITGHVGYMLNTNVRLTIENIFDAENEENSFLLGIVTAF